MRLILSLLARLGGLVAPAPALGVPSTPLPTGGNVTRGAMLAAAFRHR